MLKAPAGYDDDSILHDELAEVIREESYDGLSSREAEEKVMTQEELVGSVVEVYMDNLGTIRQMKETAPAKRYAKVVNSPVVHEMVDPVNSQVKEIINSLALQFAKKKG